MKKDEKHLRTALAAAMLAVTVISAGFFLTLGYQVGGGYRDFPIVIEPGIITVVGDGVAPIWTDYSPKGTQEVQQGSTLTLTADWNDTGIITLANATLYTNESGKMEAIKSVKITGASNVSSFSYKVVNVPDYTIEWYITASDEGSETNSTPKGIITTKDLSGPVCTLSQESDTPAIGATNVLSAFCTDDSEVVSIKLITDEGKVFAEISDKYDSPATVEGKSASAEFKWKNLNITKVTTVNWKVRATDGKGNERESAILSFTVGGEAGSDIEPPAPAAPPSFATATPYEGVKVDVSVSFTDNEELKTVWLEVGGQEVASKDVSGTSATETLTWTATGVGDVKWKVFAQDEAGNVYSSDEFTFTVLAAPAEIPCDPAGKPDDKLGTCREVDGTYEQVTVTYKCDTSTGTWKQVVGKQACEPGILPPEVAPISLITAALIIIVGIAATYFLALRKPSVPKARK